MNLGTFRLHIRDLLGDPGPYGFWNDDELDRAIKQESDRHAQEALSVEAQVSASSVPDVIDYQLPDDFGEIKDVRFIDNITTGPESLDYVRRTEILEELGEINTVGEPWVFYRWEDAIGLYPVPNKPPIFKRTFETDNPENYVRIYDPEASGTRQFFNNIDLNLEDDEDDPFYRILISHISVYLRRDTIAMPGTIELYVREPDKGFYNISQPLPASAVAPLGDWFTFDFNHSPIEVLAGDPRTYQLLFITSDEYISEDRSHFGEGVQVAVEDENDTDVAFFQLHQMKDDIEIDYYRNTTDDFVDDDSLIQLPSRYHRTLIKMVLGRVWKKQGRDLQTALVYDREVMKEISYARSQAQIKTLGSILRTERHRRRSRRPYMTHVGGSRFRGRAW